MVVAVIVVLGIIIYFASKREKQERVERVTNLGDDILYMQTYLCDVMLAGYDLIFDTDKEQKFMEFKRLIMNSQTVIYILEDQLRRGQNRKHEAGYEESVFVLNDLRKLKEAVSNSNSLDELHPKLQGSLQSYLVDAFAGEVTREELLEHKDKMIREHKESTRRIISSI